MDFIPFGWAYPELACHWRTHILTQLVPSLMRALDGNSVEEGHGVCSIQGIGACHPGKGERVVTDVVWICLVKMWFYSNWSYCFMFVVYKLCYCFKFSRDTVALYCLYPEWSTPTSPPWGQKKKDSRNHFPSAQTPPSLAKELCFHKVYILGFEQSFDWDTRSPPTIVGTAG